MQSLEIHLSDSTHYDLVARAAEDQQDIDQFAKAQLMRAVGRDDAVDADRSFEEYLVEAFHLESGTETAANVIGVATRIADGMPWTEAVQARAETYAAETSDIEDPDAYGETVRECCTSHLGLSPAEFEDRVHALLEEYYQRTDATPGTMTTDPHPAKAPADSYEIRLTDGNEIVAQFGTDPVADQSQLMQLVVNHLVSEHDLNDRISIPYVVETETLINSTPADPDSDEEIRQYEQSVSGYYLDTSASKGGKEARLTELARECGLGVTVGEAWERR